MAREGEVFEQGPRRDLLDVGELEGTTYTMAALVIFEPAKSRCPSPSVRASIFNFLDAGDCTRTLVFQHRRL